MLWYARRRALPAVPGIRGRDPRIASTPGCRWPVRDVLAGSEPHTEARARAPALVSRQSPRRCRRRLPRGLVAAGPIRPALTARVGSPLVARRGRERPPQSPPRHPAPRSQPPERAGLTPGGRLAWAAEEPAVDAGERGDLEGLGRAAGANGARGDVREGGVVEPKRVAGQLVFVEDP